MLISAKKISDTIQRLVKWSAVVVWLAFSFCFLIQSSSAQRSVKFREFDRDMVHSPREMARDLNYLFSDQNPLANIDPEKLKKLQDLGKEFVENLSDQEKKRVQEFAERFMKDKGLDSPEGKLLMDSLGVSPEMQSELAKEFGKNNAADLERFKDFFKNSRPPSSADQSKQEASNSGRSGDLSSLQRERLKELTKGLSKDFDQQARKPFPRSPDLGSGGSKNGRSNDSDLAKGGAGSSKPRASEATDLPKDLFDTLPDELNGPSGKSAGDRRGQGDGKNPIQNGSGLPGESFDGKSVADSQRAGSQIDGPGQRPGTEPDEQSLADLIRERFGQGKRGQGARGQGKRGPGKRGLGKRGPVDKGRKPLGNGSQGNGSQGNGSQGVGKNAGVERGVGDRRQADQAIEAGQGLQSNNGRASDKGLATSPGTGSEEIAGNAQPSRGFDETFKSWIQMEAIKNRIREFQQRSGPSDFQRRSLESAFKKGFKGLGDTLGKGSEEGLSKSEFKDKFDRVLFEAARGSAEFESGDGNDDEDGGVGSVLSGVLDRVSKAAKKNQQAKLERQRQRVARNNGSEFPRDAGEPFGISDPTSGDFGTGGFGSDGIGSIADMAENIPELPAFDPQKILIFVSIVGLVGLLLYLLLRNFTGASSSSAARKFGRSFQAAKIRSPKDLVEAVDFFIVQKFGTRARWWNARHAQNMLCAGAPGYSAKISDLLKDYVRARYMRSDLPLSSEQQLGYKKMLQELVKEIPEKQQTPAEASQDEG